jgi:hypothetical protein
MLLAGDAVMVAVEARVVTDGEPVELRAALEIRHRLTRRPIVRTHLGEAVRVPRIQRPCSCATVWECERLRSRDRS